MGAEIRRFPTGGSSGLLKRIEEAQTLRINALPDLKTPDETPQLIIPKSNLRERINKDKEGSQDRPLPKLGELERWLEGQAQGIQMTIDEPGNLEALQQLERVKELQAQEVAIQEARDHHTRNKTFKRALQASEELKIKEENRLIAELHRRLVEKGIMLPDNPPQSKLRARINSPSNTVPGSDNETDDWLEAQAEQIQRAEAEKREAERAAHDKEFRDIAKQQHRELLEAEQQQEAQQKLNDDKLREATEQQRHRDEENRKARLAQEADARLKEEESQRLKSQENAKKQREQEAEQERKRKEAEEQTRLQQQEHERQMKLFKDAKDYKPAPPNPIKPKAAATEEQSQPDVQTEPLPPEIKVIGVEPIELIPEQRHRFAEVLVKIVNSFPYPTARGWHLPGLASDQRLIELAGGTPEQIRLTRQDHYATLANQAKSPALNQSKEADDRYVANLWTQRDKTTDPQIRNIIDEEIRFYGQKHLPTRNVLEIRPEVHPLATANFTPADGALSVERISEPAVQGGILNRIRRLFRRN